VPEPVQELIIAPDVPAIAVALEPAHTALHSLWLLLRAESISGLGDWVTRTAVALTPQERETLRLVMIGLHYAVVPDKSWPSFPAYLDDLADRDPYALRDKMLQAYADFSPLATDSPVVDIEADMEAALASVEAYVAFLRERFDCGHLDEALEARAYTYVVDPPAMQALIVDHLRHMWDKFLASEWEAVKPMLQDAVTAFQQVDLSAMSRHKAAQFITGQTLRGEKWENSLESYQRVIFVPTAHAGPYLGKFKSGDTLWVLFGARLPQGTRFHAPDLSRAEIIMRLSALTDDNRLRILKLVSEEGEQSSQDIMSHLDLSQSATSRHLTQLSATGYLTERRCSGAKCYELDPERITNTLKAVSSFLLGT